MIEKIDSSRVRVRKFGILFGVLALLLAAYLIYRGHSGWIWVLAASAFFWGTAFFGYPVLRPLYVGWMTFAFVLGWVNTRLLLGLFYYLVMTPVGLILRLTGKDLLDQKFDRSASSYWIQRNPEPFDAKRYERLF